ncbi:hypothetical protein [Mycolicibacterium tusciae]|uniref:hypothetical protein n=1 Tax=Mycolicibacterium tusciae TaxID=75922 RepID=UPI00024A3B61|nr:hypothetical protein [Mycolicibacterium tusciae]
MAHHVPPSPTPDQVWAALAPLLSAPGRTTMRLYNPKTGKFSTSRQLTRKLPGRPAAVYLYTEHAATTRILALDFDSTRGGPAAVQRDVDIARHWLTAAGGRLIIDRSTNGGMHIICPLAPATSATHTEITHLVAVLAAHLPTLDTSPNGNIATGCLSLPGTLDKQGGHRQLLGSLSDALNTIADGSTPDFLPTLYAHLGILKRPSTPAPGPTDNTTTAPDSCPALTQFTTGDGEDLRLAPAHSNRAPIPAPVLHYATHGDPTGSAGRTWPTHSEARMSVIYHAVIRGYTLSDLRALIAPAGPWHHGLGAAFNRYANRADKALSRDFSKAMHHYYEMVLIHRHRQHKLQKNSPGGATEKGSNPATRGPSGPVELRRWLAYAFRWADTEYQGRRQRWTVKVVLQALAYLAMKSGQQVNGVWVVAVGGRSLSLAAGLMTADAVWKVLRDMRDRVGAPLILTRRAVGRDADAYALTNQGADTVDIGAAERIRIEPVHDAWQILGWRLQRIHDLVVHHGLTGRTDIYAAAAVTRSTGDAMILDLQITGLIAVTGRGTVGPGHTTLDAIATQHRLHDTRQDRIERYRRERNVWQQWLDNGHDVQDHLLLAQTADEAYLRGPSRDRALAVHAAYLQSVLATGPPPVPGYDASPDTEDDDTIIIERRALTLLWELLGAVVVPESASA